MRLLVFWQCSSLCACRNQAQLEQVEPACRLQRNGACLLIWSMPTTIHRRTWLVFPAAILQAPFYDLHQSSSANYGGIRAVIAHEISHAFDTNGASFDENGSLKDWWTENDYAAFKEKTQKLLTNLMDKILMVQTINGKLTVSENVADLGGIAAALEAAKREQDFSAEGILHNFGRIWRMKGRPEFMKLWLASMLHAPAKLRVNASTKLRWFLYNLWCQRRRRYVAFTRRARDYLVRQN